MYFKKRNLYLLQTTNKSITYLFKKSMIKFTNLVKDVNIYVSVVT